MSGFYYYNFLYNAELVYIHDAVDECEWLSQLWFDISVIMQHRQVTNRLPALGLN